MEKILTDLMDQIDEECRAEGYYPDLVELYAMAMARLDNAPDNESD